MHTLMKSSFLFSTFILFVCLNAFFLTGTEAQVNDPPVSTSTTADWTFESIDVPGVDFLELTASSDFEDYAGNTRSADGKKTVGFTLIDGVFKTYDFPGSQNTFFYGLSNTGIAIGHYEGTDGLYHGVILEDGELRQYDFPEAVQTFIYGISDATGALTGNMIDAAGVRRGFSGDRVVAYPEAAATYADFVTGGGNIAGSFVDADGIYHAYLYTPDRRFLYFDPPNSANLEYFFVHGVNDAGEVVARSKVVGDIPRSYVGTFYGLQEVNFPDSVSTEGWNINQDGSVVGHYDTPDGRRHGFIAKPIEGAAAQTANTSKPTRFHYTFETIDVPGLDFLTLTASSDFEDYAGNIQSPDGEKTVAFTLIDGVFTTYDFPGAKHTYFYALGNNGNAAGHYENSEGLSHGVILEDGVLRQYDFPNAVQTEIYGMSDATGTLTGNFIDTDGVRRGFSGNTIIEYPGASETYADFVSGTGNIVGSYIDADGIYQAYMHFPDGRFASMEPEKKGALEYFFIHGINNAGVRVARSKAVGDIPRTYVGTFSEFHELRVPGSVSTEGWNINQDGSVVGHYDTPDGRRHGFIARPAPTR